MIYQKVYPFSKNLSETAVVGNNAHPIKGNCTTIHRYPILSTRYSVMCKVYTGYCSTSEIENGLCACTVDNPLAKARGLSLRTGAQTMLYLSQKQFNMNNKNANLYQLNSPTQHFIKISELDVSTYDRQDM